MALKQRGGRRYAYQSRRQDGRVVTEYCGAGPIADAIAEAHAAEQLERQALRARQRVLQEQLDEAKIATERFEEAVDVLLRAVFLFHGFHRPNRGPWRKKQRRLFDG